MGVSPRLDLTVSCARCSWLPRRPTRFLRALGVRSDREQPLVHFVAIDTDAWIYPTEWNRMEPQWNYLKENLASVNRTRTPWVVVYGHRALYCGYSSATECMYETDALRYGRILGGGNGTEREYGAPRAHRCCEPGLRAQASNRGLVGALPPALRANRRSGSVSKS